MSTEAEPMPTSPNHDTGTSCDSEAELLASADEASSTDADAKPEPPLIEGPSFWDVLGRGVRAIEPKRRLERLLEEFRELRLFDPPDELPSCDRT